MAGAGYKLFNTGDVLTAAQVNTYLNEQTVMVFASAAARTSALTSVLAEGMVSYLQDTNAVEVYNGSAWVGVSGAGDVTEVQAGTGISVASGTGPIPVVTNTMATAVDAKGDLIVGTGADTFSRLAVGGTNGHTLQVDSSTSTGLKWAAAAGGGANWSLLNTGGTALTGASTITVSGISGKDKIMVIINGASTTSAGQWIGVRLNTDTGTNYYRYGADFYFGSTYSAANFEQIGGASSYIPIALMSGTASSIVNGYCLLSGCDAAGVKVFNSVGAASPSGSNQQQDQFLGGYYDSASTISSVSLFSSADFDAGTLYVYASA